MFDFLKEYLYLLVIFRIDLFLVFFNCFFEIGNLFCFIFILLNVVFLDNLFKYLIVLIKDVFFWFLKNIIGFLFSLFFLL